MKTYVIGHKNPDTDSVVSAIALSDFWTKRGKETFPAIANNINKETSFILKNFGFDVPGKVTSEEKRIILVDHNEASQISENVRPEEIIAIYDHHKLGGLSTSDPIYVRIKVVGSTSTLIAKAFKNHDVDLSKEIASILLCGIISDTLKFTSPTTTEEDKIVVEELNKIAGIDIEKIASEMFKAKSDLTGVSAEDIVGTDYKNFDIAGKKIGVGVFETVDVKPALERRTEILSSLLSKKEQEECNYIIFAIIDILNQKAYVLANSEEEKNFASNALKASSEEDYLVSEGIVSRKKQIIPALEDYLK